MSIAPQQIEKENLLELKFPDKEVLGSSEEIHKRRVEIERAVTLGNNYKGKVRIVFEDTAGIKQVETTLWGVTDKRIILKGEAVIPIHRIHEIKI